MTNSESQFIKEVYSFSITLRTSGRKRTLPIQLDQGIPVAFNGYQSVGEYAVYLSGLLDEIQAELSQVQLHHDPRLALIMADLAVLLESRRVLPLHEKCFDKSWSIILKMPELIEEVESKTALFRETQYHAFRRWEAMRKCLQSLNLSGFQKRSDYPTNSLKLAEAEANELTNYRWTGTLTDAVEVSVGLVDAGLIRFPAKATQEQKLRCIAAVLHLDTESANLNQTLSQLLNRKSGPTKALDRMKQALEARLEHLDGR